MCYSYSHPVATLSTLIASSIKPTISILHSIAIIQCVCSIILCTVSDQTDNVALNNNGRYNHYVLITIHNFVYMLMFCFLHSQLNKQI